MIAAIRAIVRAEAIDQALDPDVIEAIVMVESAGNPKVARYEKSFSYLWKDLEFSKIQKITQETERIMQKTSWGLGQVMGATARWLGYSAWLPDLCEPKTSAFWMCRYYKRVCSKQLYLNDALSVYNAGSVRRKEDGSYLNQEYVNKVLLALGEIQGREQKQNILM